MGRQRGEQQKLEDIIHTYMHALLKTIESNLRQFGGLGGGKKQKSKKAKKEKNTNIAILRGVFKLRQNKTTRNKKKTKKQTNKQVGSLLTGPESIFTAASERILIP
jgi:hypothetical protein